MNIIKFGINIINKVVADIPTPTTGFEDVVRVDRNAENVLILSLLINVTSALN